MKIKLFEEFHDKANESIVELPYDETEERRHNKMQDNDGYWDYSPVYASIDKIKELTGKDRNFTKDEWDAFYKAHYEDVNSRDDDEKGENTGYINVNLGGNEGEVLAKEKGFAVYIGKHTGYADATDLDKLRKTPVFIITMPEVIEYLKKNHK